MKKIDIIVPVYFAPELSIRSLQGLIKNTNFSNRNIQIYAIDDSGSEKFNNFFRFTLEKLNLEKKINLITHSRNKGLIEACYTGIKQRDSDYKVLLNSDTFVMPNWLDEMIKTAESDDSIALVNPQTNKITSDTDLGIPKGSNINELHRFIENYQFNKDAFIDLVTTTGFCLLIKSKYIKKYGFLDKIYKKGYCEETDLHFRYLTQGLRGVLAPKSFVYHRGEGSFDDKNELFKKNIEILMSRYKDIQDSTYPEFKQKTILNHVRKQLKKQDLPNPEIVIISSSNNFKHGGVKVLHNICNLLNEKGISTTFSYVFEEVNKIPNDLDMMYTPIAFDELLEKNIKPKIILFSLDNNAYETIKLVEKIRTKNKYRPKVIQIVQDIEGWFWNNKMEYFKEYIQLADKHFAVSSFVADKISELSPNLNIQVIKNAITLDFFGNSLKFKSDKFTNSEEEISLCAMMRNDRKRGAKIIEKALKSLDQNQVSKVKKIHFTSFGNYKLKESFHNIKIIERGTVPEKQVIEILSNSNIFIEASFYQGFGLTALEALFCGCSVLSSTNKGAKSILPKDTDLVKYFKIGNVEDLAEKIVNNINNFPKNSNIKTNSKLFLKKIIFQNSLRKRGQDYQKFFKQELETFSKEKEINNNNDNRFRKAAIKALLTFIQQTYETERYTIQHKTPDRFRYRIADKIFNLFEIMKK
jgi:GT2 family glycosyltransferase